MPQETTYQIRALPDPSTHQLHLFGIADEEKGKYMGSVSSSSGFLGSWRGKTVTLQCGDECYSIYRSVFDALLGPCGEGMSESIQEKLKEYCKREWEQLPSSQEAPLSPALRERVTTSMQRALLNGEQELFQDQLWKGGNPHQPFFCSAERSLRDEKKLYGTQKEWVNKTFGPYSSFYEGIRATACTYAIWAQLPWARERLWNQGQERFSQAPLEKYVVTSSRVHEPFVQKVEGYKGQTSEEGVSFEPTMERVKEVTYFIDVRTEQTGRPSPLFKGEEEWSFWRGKAKDSFFSF